MAKVPQGEFKISETRKLSISKPFWVSRTEITWDVFDIYAYQLDQKSENPVLSVARPSKPYVLPGRQFGHLGYGASAMTYLHAQQFVAWLSAKTGHTFRLLSPEEWVYTCLAGKSQTAEAWTWDNADDKAHKTATKKPNAFGIYDLLGNLGEWVQSPNEAPFTMGGTYLDSASDLSCDLQQPQTPAWNLTDPQLPKSKWWLPDAPFVGLRIAMEDEAP